jgi:hypothetical protein
MRRDRANRTSVSDVPFEETHKLEHQLLLSHGDRDRPLLHHGAQPRRFGLDLESAKHAFGLAYLCKELFFKHLQLGVLYHRPDICFLLLRRG